MQSIAVPLSRSSNAHVTSRTSIADLIATLSESEARDNPDEVASAACLHMVDADHLATPAGGEYRLNEWSRQQLARLLGVRWERWFENADGKAVADEINCRLRRTEGELRLRTRRRLDGTIRKRRARATELRDRALASHRAARNVKPEPTSAPGAGWRTDTHELRALVSPRFTAIQDSAIVAAIGESIAGDVPVLRVAVTERTSTIMLGMGQPYRPGGDGCVGDLWGSLLLRNSGTGYAALACHLSLLRLACLNGMVVPHGDAVVLRSVHRGLHLTTIEERLQNRLRDLPMRFRRGGDLLALAAGIEVADIDAEIRSFLMNAGLPQRHAIAIRSAYAREPHPSVFGISQSITLSAQQLASEERYELELAAGNYVRERTQLAS